MFPESSTKPLLTFPLLAHASLGEDSFLGFTSCRGVSCPDWYMTKIEDTGVEGEVWKKPSGK